MQPVRRSEGWRRALIALALALGLHLAVLPLLRVGVPDTDPRPRTATEAAPSAPALPELEASAVTLLDSLPGASELLPLPGAGDELGWGAGHPLPSILDTPGRRAATAGGVGRGGPESFAERRYREQANAEVWNGVPAHRQPRDGARDTASSDEWIARDPRPGYDDQTRRRRAAARAGDERGASGVDDGVGERDRGERGVAARWDTADPVFDRGARARVAQRRSGEVVPASDRAMTEEGERSSDTGRRGPVADDKRVAAGSTARVRDPIDLASPAAGGHERDLRGDRRALGTAPGRGGSTGTAASSRAGAGERSAVRARRGNPYFRNMYRRVEREVRYPRELALALEQGQAVVRFALHADGRIADLVITKPSGFAELDREVLRAIRAAAPFGPVPPVLLDGRDRITVLAPYSFRNPLIR